MVAMNMFPAFRNGSFSIADANPLMTFKILTIPQQQKSMF